MLANVSYREAKEAIFGVDEAGLTHSHDLKAALKKLSRVPAPIFIALGNRDFRALSKPALLKTNLRANDEKWHWIVWTGERLTRS
jgi:hypothetical protein